MDLEGINKLHELSGPNASTPTVLPYVLQPTPVALWPIPYELFTEEENTQSWFIAWFTTALHYTQDLYGNI